MDPRGILTSKYIANYTGPILFVDTSIVAGKIAAFKQAMPRVGINYAVKSNPHVSILSAVARAGGSFDVASLQETQEVLQFTDAKADQLVYSNPIRPARYLTQCSELGVKWFVVDCLHELIKVAKYTNNPQIYIRLDVPNDMAAYSLSGKFGASLKEATLLVDYCVAHNLCLRGASFHIGSQALDPQAWVRGIQIAKNLFHYMEYKNIHPDFLNIGGGFPAEYNERIQTSIQTIGDVINAEIADIPDTFRIIAEPGRYICAEAGNLLSQVISMNIRDNQLWAYLDTGMFHGLNESSISDAFSYYTQTVSCKPRVKFTIAGPTCDSMDIVSKSTYLPHNLVDGDFIVFQSAGAYSTTYSTNFNGFPAPRVVVL